MRVGNGRLCRFWTDNWSPFGSFESYLLRGTASRSGISRTATLSELCVEGQWALPPARSDEFLQVYTFLTTVELREEEDRYEWCVTDAPTNRSSTGDVYRKLNRKKKRGIQTDPSCLLCNSAPESRDHILFQCPYAWDLLQQVLTRCRVTPLLSWNDSVTQMQNLTGEKNLQRLTHLGWQATIYWL
ncbi:hypothetical protein F2Q69_00002069 [Brassica cretica]|uniref:Reverse transcriptase zinc-binding domain-containing protein n=1 Tax=Brassica cretica TaxID=69181 RepID=A0A8S9NV10_BRACR|nr:hypothetical protein F2Q69_00002069 [Brassica cretica]